MKLEGVLIPCIVDGIMSRKDGSVSVKLESQEIKPMQAGEIFNLRGKMAFAYLSAVQPDENEKKIIDALDPELKSKTPSKRLRDVLYVYWEQNRNQPNVPDVFDYFYKQKMESFIESIKQELV